MAAVNVSGATQKFSGELAPLANRKSSFRELLFGCLRPHEVQGQNSEEQEKSEPREAPALRNPGGNANEEGTVNTVGGTKADGASTLSAMVAAAAAANSSAVPAPPSPTSLLRTTAPPSAGQVGPLELGTRPPRSRQMAPVPQAPPSPPSFGAASGGSRPSSMAHPMWPPLVPSPPGSTASHHSQPGSYFAGVMQSFAKSHGGGPRGAVSDESLQRSRQPESNYQEVLMRSMSSSAKINTGTDPGSTSPLHQHHNTSGRQDSLRSPGSARLSAGAHPAVTAPAPSRLTAQQHAELEGMASTGLHEEQPVKRAPGPASLQAMPAWASHPHLHATAASAEPSPPSATPVPRVVVAPPIALAATMTALPSAVLQPKARGSPVTGTSPPAASIVNAALRATPLAPSTVAPLIPFSVVLTAGEAMAGSGTGRDGSGLRSLQADQSQLSDNGSGASLMSDQLYTAWDDERAPSTGPVGFVSSCPWPLRPLELLSTTARGLACREAYATWPGTLGVYMAGGVKVQPVAGAEDEENAGETNWSDDGAGSVPASVPLPKIGSAPAAGGGHMPQLRRSADGPSQLPKQGTGRSNRSDPLNRLTVRRTLRVSSTELQEAVKASLLGAAREQAHHHSAPQRTPTLDLELCTLNISKLDAELFGLVMIGRGGGGLVFRAVWQGAQVAVKFMIGKTSASVNMGALEAVLAASVNHPNVVQTYGFDVTKVRESSFRNTNLSQIGGPGFTSSAIVGILRELEREKTRMQVRAGLENRNSFGSSASPLGSPAVSADNFAQLAQLREQANERNLMASFNSEEGFGEPAELMPANSWSLAQVLKALNAQPGMFMTHILMEFCDRGTLLSALQRGVFRVGGTSGDSSRFNDRVVLRAALRTARDIARGMQHLHASGIIHGDLKPGNVLLKGSRSDRRGFTAKVADFGLSKVVMGNALLEMHHWSTVTHMAPEVIQGTWCKQSDVYSFGVMLWQLMCGEPLPFKDLTIQQLILGVSQGRLRLQWPQHCHASVAKLGEACVAFEASVRPTFQEIGDVLVQIEQNVRNELRWAH